MDDAVHTDRALRADLDAERDLTAALTELLAEAADAASPRGLGLAEDVIASARLLTDDAAATAGLRVTFRPVVGVGTVPGPVATHLLAALREGLSNVVRHAQARAVTVDLELVATGVTLGLIDDGTGVGRTVAGGGLQRLGEHAARLGGWCLGHRLDDGGTSLVWHVPAAGPRLDADVPSRLAGRVADAVGPLAARLSLARGADRFAVTGNALRQLIDADCYAAFVATPDGHSLKVVRTVGFSEESDPIGAIVPRRGSLPWHAVSTGRAVRVGALGSLPAHARHLGPLPLGAGLVIPLRPGPEPATAVGLARAAGRPGFRQAEVDVAVTLAAVGSAMLDLQPVQTLIDAWPSAEFDYTGAVSVAGFPNVSAAPRNVRR